MVDGLGRNIRYLRVSVTDRCNLRCRYCMPADGVTPMDHSDLLTYEQIVRVVRMMANLGVDKVRLTGGEPLVRKGLPDLAARITQVPGVRTLALTTNGALLADQLPALAAAGVTHVNLSLDTLDRDQYAAIARRDGLPDALRGLRAALDTPGLTVKVNCVLLGENDDQLVPLAALAKENDLAVRFIELMPLGLAAHAAGQREGAVKARLEEAFGSSLPVDIPETGGPAHYITFPGFRGKVGFISALSHRFCDQCDRVRLTSGGFLKTCLQYDKGVDLKPLLDGGADDETLRNAVLTAVSEKPAGHHFTAAPTSDDERRNMNEIGG